MASAIFELSEDQKKELKATFGEWVNFSDERRYYDHDIGVLPSLLRPLIGNTVPAAVVKAMNEEDVSKLLKWANHHKVPVVTRAAASSGYSGVIPSRGGIVLDVTSLNRLLEVDVINETATVEAGIVWEDLENKLEEYGLSPRVVPSSAPASTVGGWFAQGGAGFGSFRYGWFIENVKSVRVVLPNGEVRTFSGEDLSSVYATMGTVGVITQVTLNLRKRKEVVPSAYSFKSAKELLNVIKEVSVAELGLYVLNFLNPKGAMIKNRVPVKTHHGHPHEKGPELPEEYILLAAAFEDEAESAFLKLDRIVSENNGRRLSDEIAFHEWDERYKPMKAKRLGPSVIPFEVVVPLNSLYLVLSELEHKLKLDFVLEGVVVKGNEVVLLGLIPHDERRFTFNFAYALSLTALNIALKYGGRPYAGGLYLGSFKDRVYGEDRLSKILELKKSVDPSGIMNPEKIEGKTSIGLILKLGSALEPLIRPFSNMAKVTLKERFFSAKGLPEDVAWYAYTCAQCGYCVRECDQFYGRGWESQSPRGKWYWLKRYIEGKEKMTQEQVNKFLICTTCELCSFRCQIDIPIEESWEKLRGELVQERGFMTFPPFEIMAASLRKEKNIWANYADKRDTWIPEDIRPKIKDKSETAYFAGCTASFVENDIAQGAVKLLDKAGVEFTVLGKEEACCGIPMLVAGKWEVFEEAMSHNIQKMKDKGVKRVITSCPACYLVWAHYYKEWAQKKGIDYPFEAKHYTEVLAEKAKKGELKFEKPLEQKVTFHDSCHMGRALGVYEEPRELIKAIPGIDYREMEYNRERAHCCGSVLTLIGEPPVAYELGAIRLKEAKDVGADTVLAVCPCCQFQLRVANSKKGMGVEVRDLAAFVGEAMGVKLKDPTGYALDMWKTFDAMIDLMKPEKMADLMKEMLPQMFEAMPGYMISSIKVMKRVPGMLALMKLAMPKMMPFLMPIIMPKVMPDMLKAVEKRVPMPDFMKEQMPDLMPGVMENLMPKMLPEIAPLVTPRMIEYIRERL